ncbi:MAG: VWA domain-containing protein [Clostridia bacterium]|nr:VWA domain-containing protein [Clostridia bacterium]
MTNSSDVLYNKLCGFAAFLRKQGLQIGLSEMQDMLRALHETGFEDRAVVKQVLCALTAKSAREQQAFSECFDTYFVSQEQFERNEAAQREAERVAEEQRRIAEEELQFNGKPIDLREDLIEVYARMPQEERDKLQRYAEQYKDKSAEAPKLYEGFIRSVFMRSLLEQQMLLEDAAEGSSGAPSDADLLYRDISNFREEEIPRAYQLIDQVTRRINGEIAARKRTSVRSDQLDFKKTIHAGLSTGGTLPKLYYKRRSGRKKRVVMLCDVSGSMLQFSEFAIRFIKSMSEVSDHSETYLFSEIVQKVNPFALENMNAFGRYVRHSPVWGRGTNIGRALETLEGMQPQVLGPATVLLILSDAKSVDMDRAELALTRAQKLSGSVVWMNPIPEAKWQYLKGVMRMKPHCQMLPCSTLQELARACAKLV